MTNEFSQDEFLDSEDLEHDVPETQVPDGRSKARLARLKIFLQEKLTSRKVIIGVSGVVILVSGAGLAVIGHNQGWFTPPEPVVQFGLAQRPVQQPVTGHLKSSDRPDGDRVAAHIEQLIDQRVQAFISQYPTKGQVERSFLTAHDDYATRASIEQVLARLKQLETKYDQFTGQIASVDNKLNQLDIAGLKATIITELSSSGSADSDAAVVKQLFEQYEQESQLIASLKQAGVLYQQQTAQSMMTAKQHLKTLTTRVLALENAKVSIDRLMADTSTPLTIEKKRHSYYLTMASDKIAFIVNTHTTKQMRVQVGADISGCGRVTEIDPSTRMVKTTDCTIYSKTHSTAHSTAHSTVKASASGVPYG